jgi:hypothetical protein
MSGWCSGSRCLGWRAHAATGINCWRFARCSTLGSPTPMECMIPPTVLDDPGIGATAGGLLAEKHGAEPRGRLIRDPHKIGRSPGQFAGAAAPGAEQGSLLRLRDPGCVQICVEIVVAGHLVDLAAFLVQPHPPPFALAEIILDLHRDGGAHAREGIGHQRPIAMETLESPPMTIRAFFIRTTRRRIRNRRWKMVPPLRPRADNVLRCPPNS